MLEGQAVHRSVRSQRTHCGQLGAGRRRPVDVKAGVAPGVVVDRQARVCVGRPDHAVALRTDRLPESTAIVVRLLLCVRRQRELTVQRVIDPPVQPVGPGRSPQAVVFGSVTGVDRPSQPARHPRTAQRCHRFDRIDIRSAVRRAAAERLAVASRVVEQAVRVALDVRRHPQRGDLGLIRIRACVAERGLAKCRNALLGDLGVDVDITPIFDRLDRGEGVECVAKLVASVALNVEQPGQFVVQIQLESCAVARHSNARACLEHEVRLGIGAARCDVVGERPAHRHARCDLQAAQSFGDRRVGAQAQQRLCMGRLQTDDRRRQRQRPGHPTKAT